MLPPGHLAPVALVSLPYTGCCASSAFKLMHEVSHIKHARCEECYNTQSFGNRCALLSHTHAHTQTSVQTNHVLCVAVWFSIVKHCTVCRRQLTLKLNFNQDIGVRVGAWPRLYIALAHT